MAVWINGPFGVGKTSVTRVLRARIPDAVVADPERIGYAMKRTFWRGQDYQDVDLWRRLTVRQVARADRKGTAIVPMTVVQRELFDEVTKGATVFALVADRATLEARIAGAVDAHEWRRANLDRCLEAFADDSFGTRIPTDGLTTEQVADEILRRL
jgi:broad-specificity NMP kinase